MVRVNEVDGYLVSDIVAGYYDRQHFRDSQLLADRHSAGPKSRGQAAIKPILRRNDSDDGNDSNSDSEEDAENGCLRAAPDGLCVPPSLADGDRELVPQLKLRMSTTPTGGAGEVMTLTVAEQRRERRRERRKAHQDRIRMKEAERESERRRMRADKERRDREVARAVREAEDAERVRLLREAQEAEDAAPVAARLMRTMQRKAAGAVAAAKARAGASAGVAAVVVDRVGPTKEPVETGITADDYPFGSELMENDCQQAHSTADEDGGRRPSQVRFDKEKPPVLIERPEGNGLAPRRRGSGGDGGNLGGATVKSDKRESKVEAPAEEGMVGAALAKGTRNRKHGPKKGAKADTERNGGMDSAARTPPLARAREKAAAAVSAAITVGDSEGGKPEFDAAVTSTPGTAAPPSPTQAREAGADTTLPKRKPSEERVGEPRAVFMHRASMVPSSTDAAAAGKAAGGQVTTGTTGAGEAAGATHQRSTSNRGRVGSVLPA